MTMAAERLAEVLALPAEDRAYLARELIVSLEETVDPDAEVEWRQVIDRRSREIEEGRVVCRPMEEARRNIRARLDADRQPS